MASNPIMMIRNSTIWYGKNLKIFDPLDRPEPGHDLKLTKSKIVSSWTPTPIWPKAANPTRNWSDPKSGCSTFLIGLHICKMTLNHIDTLIGNRVIIELNCRKGYIRRIKWNID